MKLEVILSVMNLDKKELNKMNITSKCIVINQTNKEGHTKYKNFDIYSYKDKGVSVSRNHGIEQAKEDILLFCDDDLVYKDGYEKIVLDEFKKNKDADVIMFNVVNKVRNKKLHTKNKRLHLFNSLKYATYNIAIRRKSIGKIRFNTDFGPGAKYSNGSDTMFIIDVLKNKLKIYSCPIVIGEVYAKESTWFNGYNEKYFYCKGVLFTAINKRFRHVLMLQYLVRHNNVLTEYKFKEAYRIMLKGSKEYLHDISNS